MSAFASAEDHQIPESPKLVRDRDGNTFASVAEKMKYYMRRLRNSDLPHWPRHERKDGSA